MQLSSIQKQIPSEIYDILSKDISELRPAQQKAIDAGLLSGKSLLICTPTASGKTLIAELAATRTIIEGRRKAVYVAPLKALASEKYKEFKRKYEKLFRVAISSGDLDTADEYLRDYSLICCTSEKLDSLIRHKAHWISQIGLLIIDEIHLLHDPTRGPTLEILITLLKKLYPHIQILGLSATIGNPKELASWLGAELVQDSWRPVELKQGIYTGGKLSFY